MGEYWEAFYFRCPCCGIWLWTWRHLWRQRGKEIWYCEGCSVNRIGRGRGQCEYCQLYPNNAYWDEPKPTTQIIISIR